MKTFGERMRQLRTEKNVSCEQLGKHLGVQRAAVSKWENDEREPNVQMLFYIAKALGTTPNYLLGFDEDDSNSDTTQRDYNTKSGVCDTLNQQTSVCFEKSGCLLRNTQNGALQVCTKCYEFTSN